MSVLEGVTIPFPMDQREPGGRRIPVSSVYHDVVDALGVEELATYIRLMVWHDRGEAADLDRLAKEQWFGDRHRAGMWVDELRRKGLVVTSEAYAAELDELAELMMEPGPVDVGPIEWADGTWSGSWPVAPDVVCSDRGVPVVYYAYDAAGLLSYIGSTGHFRSRMDDHLEHRRSIGWATWRARECASRKAAYVLEAGEIDRLKPPLNRPGSTRGADFVRRATR